MRDINSSIKVKALNLLARREYTRAELQKKLLTWARNAVRQRPVSGVNASFDADDFENNDESDHGYDDASQHESGASSMAQNISTLLDTLQARGLLSDERALESLLNQKAHRFGVNRLRQDMTSKGFDTATMQTALDGLKETEFERAYTAWQRKFSAPPSDQASYGKQARFLSYRGFSSDTVRKVLEQVRRKGHAE